MGRPKKAIDYIDILKKMGSAGIKSAPKPQEEDDSETPLPPLNDRIKTILGIIENKKKNAGNMTFFVMYDIESDKVRRYVVKYLEKQGCCRVQKSIFLANLEMEKYHQIREDLEAVQSVYENKDSIIVLPVSTDYLNMMKLIGNNVDFDIITRSKNTLFF